MNIDYGRLKGWAIGVFAMFLAILAVATLATVDGIQIPADMSDEVVEAAQADDYELPEEIAGVCADPAELNDEQIDDARTILVLDDDDEFERCDRSVLPYTTDASRWGALALVALVAVGLALRKLRDGQRTIGDLVGLAVIFGAFVLGGVFGQPLWELVTNYSMGGELFWRGFIAAALLAGSAYWAYHPTQSTS